ncbi:MAG: TspO/MBR family protein [Novosphingobium sp.]
MSLLASRGQLRASFVRWALFVVPAILLLGFISGQLSGSGPGNPWYASLAKPDIMPPSIAFPVAWTVLYALMGLALAFIGSAWGAHGRKLALGLFVAQLIANLAWSPLFFGQHQITAALVLIGVLDLLVLATLVLFWRIRMVAGILLLPYMAWLVFATVLNWQILELNPAADGGDVSGAVQRIEL